MNHILEIKVTFKRIFVSEGETISQAIEKAVNGLIKGEIPLSDKDIVNFKINEFGVKNERSRDKRKARAKGTKQNKDIFS